MNKEFFIIIVGFLLTLTIYGSLIGLPLILIGAYLLNKHVNNPTKEIQKEIDSKQDELDNIGEKLSKMENDKKAELDKKLSDKQTELENITEKIDTLDEKYERLHNEKEAQLNSELKFNQDSIAEAKYELAKLEEELAITRDDIEFQEYGLYEPKYNFINATAYKERLDAVRKQQKQMIKDKTAAKATKHISVDGNARKGMAMTNTNIKQILRSFNNETEVIINKVKHSNLETSKKKN